MLTKSEPSPVGDRRVAGTSKRPLLALEITGGFPTRRSRAPSIRCRRAGDTNRPRRLFYFADPQTGVAPEVWTPRPPYAFKISMFNVFCNSH